MPSVNAEAVAKEVIETVRKGLKVDKGDIIKKHGYSDSVSKRPKKVTETESYKNAISPFAKQLKLEIAKIQKEMAKRKIGDEKYKDLSEVLDKLYKNYQLATGGATENVKFSLQDLFKANAKSD